MTENNGSAIDETTRVTISPSVYGRPFGDEMVLLEFSRGEYFGLDELGAEIWRHLESGSDLGAIASAVAERYEVARETALVDILELVSHMRDQSLLSVSSGGEKK